MVTRGRWNRAQQYEQSFWEDLANRIAEGSAADFGWYNWRAEQLKKLLREAGAARLTSGSARLLEIGSGPIGIVTFFPAQERVAVDPLENYYGSHPVLSDMRDQGVDYRKGLGEALPAESGHFDLVIIENCIDHVQDISAVMNEIDRVLLSDGVLYLTVNCRSWFGYYMHRLLSRLRLDPGHPYTFTPKRITALLERHGFAVSILETESLGKAWWADLRTKGKARLKALLGVSEYLATIIAVRTDRASTPAGSGKATEGNALVAM